jgi:choline kinase
VKPIKAVILAAGRGSRVNSITKNQPKGQIDVLGKTLIQRHIDGLNKVGVYNIAVVAGYLEEQIQYPNVAKYINFDYLQTNMVYSLFCSRDFMEDDLLVLYSDILLDSSVYQKLIQRNESICVLVDKDWTSYWKFRFGDDYHQDIETLKIEDETVLEIGSDKETNFEEISGRYVGGIYIPKSKLHYFKNADSIFDNYKKVDFTTYLSQIISQGETVNARWISGGWYEIDTDQDYDLFLRPKGEILRELSKLNLKL